MVRVARLRSRELFTLTVLVMAIAVAAGSYYVFGASMALGAFLAGMVVGQSPVSHQAAADALPLRDAFAVLFFDVGRACCSTRASSSSSRALLLAGLAIVMIGKPLAALVDRRADRLPRPHGADRRARAGADRRVLVHPVRPRPASTGCCGEPATTCSSPCAIVSITLNPLLFRAIGPLERRCSGRPRCGGS